MGAEPSGSGSVTRVGTPPKRSHAPRAAEGIGSPSGGSPITRWLGAAWRVPGSNTGGHRSSRTSTLPVVAGRHLARNPAEVPVGVAGKGGSTSTSAATRMPAGRRQGGRQAPGRTSGPEAARARRRVHRRRLRSTGRVRVGTSRRSRGTRGQEPAQIAVAGKEISEQVPVPHQRGRGSSALAAEAIRTQTRC